VVVTRQARFLDPAGKAILFFRSPVSTLASWSNKNEAKSPVGSHVSVDERRQCTEFISQHAFRPIGLGQDTLDHQG
jgi:hypothetical protein